LAIDDGPRAHALFLHSWACLETDKKVPTPDR
jgi:hypothetical protein